MEADPRRPASAAARLPRADRRARSRTRRCASGIAPGAYDAILFLDVLEHLRDPDGVLRAARDWLRPGGRVLCSLPNVAHWRVRLALARGRFDYTENGLMDATHLRWFTRRTARELLTRAGLRR